MSEQDWLAERFQAHRTHLRAVAYRMLGSSTEAEDAVQEALLRLSRSDTSGVENLGGWLTTVVGQVCLDMLRSRRSRREVPLSEEPLSEEPLGAGPLGGGSPGRTAAGATAGPDPEQEAMVADSAGLALLVVLDTLSPAERLAFVLHDMFAVPYGEIGPIVGRSPDAAKMLASRARRRVQEAATVPDPDLTRQRQVVGAFLAASRDGDFQALLALLDPDAVLRADAEAVRTGAPPEVRGARAVAETFSGRAQAAQPALVDGAAGAVWAVAGRPQVVFAFTVTAGTVVGIQLLADQSRLDELELTILDC